MQEQGGFLPIVKIICQPGGFRAFSSILSMYLEYEKTSICELRSILSGGSFKSHILLWQSLFARIIPLSFANKTKPSSAYLRLSLIVSLSPSYWGSSLKGNVRSSIVLPFAATASAWTEASPYMTRHPWERSRYSWQTRTSSPYFTVKSIFVSWSSANKKHCFSGHTKCQAVYDSKGKREMGLNG